MPNTRTPSISSEVPIGRRIKGSEMLIGGFLASGFLASRAAAVSGPVSPRSSGGSLGGCLHLDPSAVGQTVLAVDDDPIADRQPLGDHRDAVLHRTDLDRAALDRVVLLDDIGIAAGWPFF